MKLFLTNLLLLAAGLHLHAAPVYDLNFLSSQGTNSVLYTGDQTNWSGSGCGTSPDFGGYSYCQGELLGDLLTGTRASVTSPSMPYFTSDGYQADIVNAQNQIIAIVTTSPAGGCSGTGGTTVTCGLTMQLITSLNGGAMSSSLVSVFSNIPVASVTTATGASQSAFILDWSNGRVDDVNVQIAAQSTPEPSTIGLVGTALLPLWLFRRSRQNISAAHRATCPAASHPGR